MPLIHDRGRLLARLNVIDVAVLLALCLMVPLAYGAYLLFRPPPPRITAIEPSKILLGTEQVSIRGEDLRPYLRVMVGIQGGEFLFANSNGGMLRLPELEPGVYDVVLLDEDRELERLRGALVVEAPPEPLVDRVGDVLAVGAFTGMDSQRAMELSEALLAFQRLPPAWGRVVGVQRPAPSVQFLAATGVPIVDGSYRIDAVLRFRCRVERRQCRVGETDLNPGSSVPLLVGGTSILFEVDGVHAPYTGSVEVEMKVDMEPEALPLPSVAALDRDSRSFPAHDALRPALLSVATVGGFERLGRRSAILRLRVPVVRAGDTWMHGGDPLRVNRDFIFDTRHHRFAGPIVRLTPIASQPDRADGQQ